MDCNFKIHYYIHYNMWLALTPCWFRDTHRKIPQTHFLWVPSEFSGIQLCFPWWRICLRPDEGLSIVNRHSPHSPSHSSTVPPSFHSAQAPGNVWWLTRTNRHSGVPGILPGLPSPRSPRGPRRTHARCVPDEKWSQAVPWSRQEPVECSQYLFELGSRMPYIIY